MLYVIKFDIHPDKVDGYLKWAKSAIKRELAHPGVIEFRAYRPVTGAHQVVVTYEFADMAAWAAWHAHEEVEKVRTELHTLALNVTIELWGPSPVIPEPIRPVNNCI